MDRSKRDFLYLIGISYFLFDAVSSLLSVEGPFQLVHWGLLAVSVILAGFSVYLFLDLIKASKEEKEKAEAEKEMQGTAGEQPQENAAQDKESESEGEEKYDIYDA